MSIRTVTNSILIILRDYYTSLGNSVKRMLELTNMSNLPIRKYVPIQYKNINVLRTYCKKTGYTTFLSNLSLEGIRDILVLCLEQVSPRANKHSRTVIKSLSALPACTTDRFENFTKMEIDYIQFPDYPYEMIECTKSVIREIDILDRTVIAQCSVQVKTTTITQKNQTTIVRSSHQYSTINSFIFNGLFLVNYIFS